MMQELLRTVSVCALVVAMGGAAVAQTGGSGGGGSSPGGAAPQTQQKEPESGAGNAAREGQPGQPGRSGETVRPKGGSAERPSERQPGAARRSDERTTQPKQNRSEGQSNQKRTPRTPRASDDRNDRKRADELRKDEQKDRARTGQDQRQRGADQAERERGKDADRQRQGARPDRDGRTQLSEQQRTNVRERFSRSGGERNRVTNVNFDIRVGASVPRSVTLHTLPADIVEVVPAYRGYRYVYVRDEIVIVDPASYAVVAVITSGGSRAAARPDRRLTLAAPDRVFVREHIDRGASIRLGIGGVTVGMTIPQGVELLPMPNVVIDRYPDLRDYRYFVYEDDIAIVDPATDEVVLIVED